MKVKTLIALFAKNYLLLVEKDHLELPANDVSKEETSFFNDDPEFDTSIDKSLAELEKN